MTEYLDTWTKSQRREREVSVSSPKLNLWISLSDRMTMETESPYRYYCLWEGLEIVTHSKCIGTSIDGESRM